MPRRGSWLYSATHALFLLPGGIPEHSHVKYSTRLLPTRAHLLPSAENLCLLLLSSYIWNVADNFVSRNCLLAPSGDASHQLFFFCRKTRRVRESGRERGRVVGHVRAEWKASAFFSLARMPRFLQVYTPVYIPSHPIFGNVSYCLSRGELAGFNFLEELDASRGTVRAERYKGAHIALNKRKGHASHIVT